MTTPGPKLLTQLRRAIRRRRYSPRTEEAYSSWVRRFVRYHDMRHPDQMGEHHINQFLTHLANDQGVSASTQAQARSAILFLYREVLQRSIDANDRSGVVSGKVAKRLPTVLTREEVKSVLGRMRGAPRLVGGLLYGSGLRLGEALSLRVKDVDAERGELRIQEAKGGTARLTMLPGALKEPILRQLERRRALHDEDLAGGNGWVRLPGRYETKNPRAAFDFTWQFIFPASRVSRDPATARAGRFHRHPSSVQRAVGRAAREVGLRKRVTTHTFRHSFATHLLEDGYDIRTIQELLGHRSVRTTMIYTHVLNRGGLAVRSPLDTGPPLPDQPT